MSAGQSVPHVHVHIIPRRSTDYGGDNDQIYPALEENERGMKAGLQARDEVKGGSTGWNGLRDEDRKPRGMEEMEKEASWLKGLMEAA